MLKKKPNLAVSFRTEFRKKQSFKNWKKQGAKARWRPPVFSIFERLFFSELRSPDTVTDCGKYANRLVFLSTPFNKSIFLYRMKFLTFHFVLSICKPALGVGSPLDKLTIEVKGLKETLASIQASLLTSVSLIQGELFFCPPYIFWSFLPTQEDQVY